MQVEQLHCLALVLGGDVSAWGVCLCFQPLLLWSIMYGIYCTHEYWPEPTSGLYIGWVHEQQCAGNASKSA